MRTLLMLCLAAGVAEAQAPLDQLRWLAGCWETGAGQRTTVEMWLPPAGGLMVGGSQTVMAGQARAWEHLRIRADGPGIVYTAIPSGQVETDFRSTALSDSGFTVENPEHDFPQRLTYRRAGPDGFIARVEGMGRDFTVRYRRISCTSPG